MENSKDHKAAAEPPLDCQVMPPALAQCPCCAIQWDEKSEQHACIELFNECVVCRFSASGKGSKSGTQEDIDAIQAKRRHMLGLGHNA